MTTYSIAGSRKGMALGLLALLGTLTAFDSIAIDMYLPAFNAIEADLGLRAGAVPASLSVFLIGLALGQALTGPLADSLGRRTPLLAGIILFGAASCLVALSSNMTMLMLGRFFQGIGGATGLVIPRAIVSDIYEAGQATKIFTFLIQVQSISPILAPIIGGAVLTFWGWRAIFWILVAFAVAAFCFTQPIVPATQPAHARTRLTLGNVVSNYWSLLKSRRYLGMVVASGLIMGTMFGYISASSFIFMTYFQQSPSAYSIIFAIYSIGMIAVGQLNMYLCTRMQLRRNLAFGFTIHVAFLVLLLLAVLLGFVSFEIISALLFLAIASLSFLFGGLTSETMYSVSSRKAGSASALLGVVQYAIGGGAGIVLGLIHNGGLLPPVALLCFCSVAAALCWRASSGLKNEQ